MTAQEARVLAGGFVSQLNEMRFLQGVVPDAAPFNWGFGEMTEFPSCYYFEWKFLDLHGRELSEQPVAGPPGFIISKTNGGGKIVSYGEWHGLIMEEQRKDDLFAFLTNAKEGKGSLFKIKSMYDLSSKEIIIFLKTLQQESFDRDTVTDILQEVLKKTKASVER